MGRTRRSWTREEDDALRTAVEHAVSQGAPLLWRDIAKSVPNRSNKDCRRRWCNTLAECSIKGPWSEEEDRRLIAAVNEHGTNWAQVARSVASRNSDQCSSHWTQVLDPSINFADWTTLEDESLLHSVLTHGTNWATIASTHVPKRNTLALKNRYSTLRLKHKNLAKGSVPRGSVRSQAKSVSPSSSRPSKRLRADSPHSGNIPGTRTQLNQESSDEDDDDDDNGDDDDDDDHDTREGTDDGSLNFDAQSTISAPIMNMNFDPGDVAFLPTPDMSDAFPNSPGALAKLDASMNYDMPGFSLSPWDGKDLSGSSAKAEAGGIHPDSGELFDPIFDTPTPWAGPGGVSLPLSGALIDDGFPGFSSPPMTVPTLVPSTSSGSMSSASGKSSKSPDPLRTNSPRADMASGLPPPTSSGRYRMSIDLVCEASQIQQVMVGLAEAGTCISMKIDAER